MRCLSCNKDLDDKESVRKAPSGFYIDLCNPCFKQSDLRDMMDNPIEEYEDDDVKVEE